MPNKNSRKTFNTTFASLCAVACILGSLNIFLFWMLQTQPPTQQALASVEGINTDKPGYIRRFTTNTQGNLVFTGNTLMLSKSNNGTNGTGGVFITTDTSKQVPTYPVGTTDDWRLSHTQFQLDIPANSEILHAELIWGGNYNYYETNLEEFVSKPIDFYTPNNAKTEINPDPITASKSDDGDKFYNYINSQNITALVAASGSGTYGCGNIPAITQPFYNTNTYAGCTLAVAYRSDKEISRNLTIFVGHEVVNQNSGRPSTISEVSGFVTPPQGSIDGSLFVSAQEGDSLIPGDQFLFGKSETELVALHSNNNLVNNFFASQINDTNGNLNKSGLFGDQNLSVTDSEIIPGKRHGWDITTVPVGNILQNNQRSAFAQGTSQGDGYIINALGIALEIKAPKFNPLLTGAIEGVGCVGRPLQYAMSLSNTGTGESLNTKARIITPTGTRLKLGSVTKNGTPIAVGDNSIVLGRIPAGSEPLVITYELEVTGNFSTNTGFVTQVVVEYEFENEELDEIITGRNTSNIISGTLIPADCEPVVPPTPPVTPPTPPVVPPVVPPVKPPVTPPETPPVTPPVTPVIPTPEPPVNPAPTPVPTPTPSVIIPTNDIGSTTQGQPVILDVTGNDGDDLDLSCLEIVNGPAFGTATIVNGKVEYIPVDDYVGLDQFTYRICSKNNTQFTPTVTVLVQVNPTINGTKKDPEVKGVNDTIAAPTSASGGNGGNSNNTGFSNNVRNNVVNTTQNQVKTQTQLPITGLYKLPLALLAIVFIGGTLSLIIPAMMKDKREEEDHRREY